MCWRSMQDDDGERALAEPWYLFLTVELPGAESLLLVFNGLSQDSMVSHKNGLWLCLPAGLGLLVGGSTCDRCTGEGHEAKACQ